MIGSKYKIIKVFRKDKEFGTGINLGKIIIVFGRNF